MQKTAYFRILFSIMLAGLVAVGCEAPEGPQGPQGPQGEQGLIGPAGEDGSTMYAGEGEPAVETGVEGDFYINKLTGDLYGPKEAEGWGEPVSLMGPKGENGTVIHSGYDAPHDSVGVIGDYYLERGAAILHGPKTESGWLYFTILKGPKGDPGEDGNANVYTSGWGQIPADDWTQDGSYQSPFDISTYSISNASGGWYSLGDINSAVFVYVRGLGVQSGGRDTDVMILPTHASVSGGGESGGIELRFTHGGNPDFAMWIHPNVGLQTGTWDVDYMINTYLPGLEFKAIVIPPSNLKAAGTPLDFSDYEAVMEYFGLDK